jgi:small subunit ribosomal protein S18
MNKCFFCQHKEEPSFKDTANLQKFLTARKKIMASEKSGLCAKHQRRLSIQIKHARFLALLPFTSYQTGRGE